MAMTESSMGNTAATVCVVIILMTCSFAAGLLVQDGGFNPFPNGENTNTTTTTTTTTDTTGTTTTTTTTTTPTTMVEPPIDTTYKLYVRVYYTNAVKFANDTQGTVVLNDEFGDPDDTWSINGAANTSELTGLSLVKRHTRVDTVGKGLVIAVSSMGWDFEVTIGSSWARTPEGIGDYLQTFSLSVTLSLECQVYLSPRWVG